MHHSILSSRRIVGSRRRASPSKMQMLILTAALVILYALLPGRSTTTTSKPPPDPTYGLLDETSSSASRLAIATFLTAGDDDPVSASEFLSNPYFAATRTLLHQLLHGAETRINTSSSNVNIDVVVLVTPNVPPEATRQLSREGAVVIHASPVPLKWWIRTGVTRWKDQFLKLRLLEQTQYKRLLFIDADTLLTSSIDALFSEPEVSLPAPTLHQHCPRADEIPLLPAQYVFAARSNNQFTGERRHPFPPLNTDLFSAGFWAAAPSAELFAYLLSVMDHYRRFDPHTMEQSLLNYAFRRAGPMPWRELHYRWTATWPNREDLAGRVVSLHDKFWKTGPDELRALWARRRDEMERYWAEHTT